MPNLSFSVGVRLDPDVHQGMKLAAAKERRSLSSLIANLCADHVNKLKAAGVNPEASEVAEQQVTTPGSQESQPVVDWMTSRPPKPRSRRKKKV